MNMRKRVLAAVLGLGLGAMPAGAGVAARTPTALHAVSGLRVIPLTVTIGRKAHLFRVEVAETSSQQALGLMFRTSMGVDEGMIFPMRPPRLANFWMHNTVLPLDIIYVGTDGRIARIAANAVPNDDTNIPSGAIVLGVLELNAGRAAQLGMKAGDRVNW